MHKRLWALILVGFAGCSSSDEVQLLNASYDPTRELWRHINRAFAADYHAKTGARVVIRQSHGGSGSQARTIIDGLDADVATLATWYDTDAMRRKGLMPAGWEERLPERSLPFYSTIVFVVRKGNPKNIRDWPDLIKPDVSVITPNPMTSGNGKLSFLAAWGAVRHRGGSAADAETYIAKLYGNVLALDTAARGATVTFAQRNLGDVHITWENEAHLEVKESRGRVEIVYPPISIKAEPHVAVVDANVDRKGTRAAAEAYMAFLYTDEGQEIIGKHHYRPINAEIRKKYTALQDIELFSLSSFVTGWDEAQSRFFSDGGVFDRIYARKAR